MVKLLFSLFLLCSLAGIESLSLVKKADSIIDVTIDCGANQAANSPVLNILTDVAISALAKCKNGDQTFSTTDNVHYTLPATLTARDSLCELIEKKGSDNFDIEVVVHYGEADSLILTKTKRVTVVCTYGAHGKDDSVQHTVINGPQAPIGIDTFVSSTVPESDLTLSIQTVDDEDAVGPIAFDRRYSLFGSYTGSVPNVGLKPVNCDAISDDGERYPVLTTGCGDGFIFDRTDGFITTGTTFRSPYFFAFHLANSGNLAFKCNVTLCSPSCEGTSCETVCGTITPFSIPNGQLDDCTGNEKFEDTCSFICDEGYNQGGPGISTCGADGIWTTPMIVCIPVDCGSVLPTVADATGTASSGTTFTKTATYTCNGGYEVTVGSSDISCLASANWATPDLVCAPVDCGAVLPTVADATGTASGGTTFTKTATYTCNGGYEATGGSSDISCLASANWATPDLFCSLSEPCVLPELGETAIYLESHISSDRTVGNATMTCHSDYVQEGPDVLAVCEFGEWRYMSAGETECYEPCVLMELPEVYVFLESHISSDRTVGNATVTCHSDYVQDGPDILLACEFGKWYAISPDDAECYD